MSKIRSKNTKPEMIVRRFLHGKGFRYRLHDKKLPGKPDIVLKKYKTIIDIRGCFWHCHKDCNKGDKISTTSEIVSGKRISAVKRDKIKLQKWKDLGWRVIIIWADCELEPKRKNSIKRQEKLEQLVKKLKLENTNN